MINGPEKVHGLLDFGLFHRLPEPQNKTQHGVNAIDTQRLPLLAFFLNFCSLWHRQHHHGLFYKPGLDDRLVPKSACLRTLSTRGPAKYKLSVARVTQTWIHEPGYIDLLNTNACVCQTASMRCFFRKLPTSTSWIAFCLHCQIHYIHKTCLQPRVTQLVRFDHKASAVVFLVFLK